MARSRGKGVEEARSTLPSIVRLAEKGHSTLITRYGTPVAAVVPVSASMGGKKAASGGGKAKKARKARRKSRR